MSNNGILALVLSLVAYILFSDVIRAFMSGIALNQRVGLLVIIIAMLVIFFGGGRGDAL